jgi:predicted dehydrogenase
VGLCDADLARAHSTAKAHRTQQQQTAPPVFSDVTAMLAEVKPQLLDIVTPPSTHLELVRLACESPHVHTVICQKPLAPTQAEGAQCALALPCITWGRPVVPAADVTDIYLCDACSCH